MPEPEWSVEKKDPGGASWATPGRIIAIVIAALTLVFLVQNSEPANVNLLFLKVSWPLWVVMAICIVLGMAIEWFWSRARRKQH